MEEIFMYLVLVSTTKGSTTTTTTYGVQTLNCKIIENIFKNTVQNFQNF